MDAAWDACCLLPAAMLILASLPVLYLRGGQRVCVARDWDTSLIAKLTVTGALVGLAAFEMIICVRNTGAVSLPEAMTFLKAFSLMCLLYADHRHSTKPSAIISAFLAFEVASAASSALRATVLDHIRQLSRCIFSTMSLAINICMLFLHERSNWDNLTQAASHALRREETYGFWTNCLSSSLFSQLTWVSTRQPAIIRIDAKDPELVESLRLRKFTTAWNRHHASKLRMLRACVSSLKREFIFAGIATICTLPFTTTAPFWIGSVVNYAQDRLGLGRDELASQVHAVFVLRSCALLLGLLVSQACSRYAISTLKLGIRGVLGEAVFSKLQKRSGPKVARHVKLEIISEHMPAMEEAADLFFRTCAKAIEALFVLYTSAGQSKFMAGLLVVHLLILAGPLRYLAFHPAKASSIASERLQQRSEAMTTVLMSMRGAKALGCTAVMKSIIQKLRSAEQLAYRKFRALHVIPQITQMTLNGMPIVYIVASGLFSGTASESAASIVRWQALMLLFAEATGYLVPDVRRAVSLHKSASKLQELLLQTSYETDARYAAIHNSATAMAVHFRGATLMSEPGGDILLDNVNVRFPRGTFTVITGDVKRSAIIQAAIGNCTISAGLVQVQGESVSYCGKDVWIQGISVRDNIIGDSPFHETWYHQVLQACCLAPDIARLPDGDGYVVETSDKLLNPGYLQRLALARSIYSRADILVLDDVLCYQDAASSASLRHNLFFHGGLLRHGTTVLLSSETWSQFTNMGAYFIGVDGTGHAAWTTQADLRTAFVAQQMLNATDPHRVAQFKRDTFAGSANQLMMRELFEHTRNEKPIAETMAQVTLIHYLGDTEVMTIIVCAAALICFTVLEAVEYLLVLDWFTSSTPFVASYLMLAGICTVVAALVFSVCIWFFAIHIGQARGASIYDRLTDTIFGASYAFFKNGSTDRVIRLTCEGFKTLNNEAFFHLFLSIYNAFALAVAVLVATYPSPAAVLALALGATLLYTFHVFQFPIWHSAKRMDATAREALQKHFVETATGSVYIRALGWELKHALQSQQCIDRYQQIGKMTESFQRLLDLCYDGIRLAWIVIAIFIGLHYNVNPGQLGLSLYIAFYMRLFVEYLFHGLNMMRNNLSIMKEMEDFIETTPQEEKQNKSLRVPERLLATGDVKMQDAGFGYEPNNERTLSHVSLNISEGFKLGVHGVGQCGKSALFLALCGVLPYTGSITVGGRELRNIPRNRLTEFFSVVPETPLVIPGATILQTLFPSDLVRPGRLHDYIPAIELFLYRLGLADLISEGGGLDGRFEDLYLTPDQMHLFSLTRALGNFLLNKESIFVIDDIMSKLSLESYVLASRLMRQFFSAAPNTAITVFGNDQFHMVEPTQFARIEGGRVQELEGPAQAQ